LTLLNPALGSDLAAVIHRCLDPDPALRFGNAAELKRALAALPAAPEAATTTGPPVADRGRYAELAAEIGEQLAAWILSETGGTGPSPPATLEAGMELAGALLALIALDPESLSGGSEAVGAGARRLAAMPPTGATGLYLGEGGVAVALARAARWSGDAEIAASSAARAAHLASLTSRGIDLFSGEAGALRAHLLMLKESSDPGALPAAVARGERLLAAAEEAGEGRLRWRSPPDPGEIEGALHVGYAHGTAGVADVLLDLAAASGETRYRRAAVAGGHWVEDQARPALDDGSGVAWPEHGGGETSPTIWCRGAAGIGLLLLRLGVAGDEIAADQARRAAQTAALGGRFLGPTSCHGLAGSVEFLLDAHVATGEPEWLEAADSLAALLETFRTDDGEWWSDSGESLGFDLLTGRAGVAVCLLRLSAPRAVAPLLMPQRAGAARMVATQR
jgi:lantibiotic modifying enzyme